MGGVSRPVSKVIDGAPRLAAECEKSMASTACSHQAVKTSASNISKLNL